MVKAVFIFVPVRAYRSRFTKKGLKQIKKMARFVKGFTDESDRLLFVSEPFDANAMWTQGIFSNNVTERTYATYQLEPQFEEEATTQLDSIIKVMEEKGSNVLLYMVKDNLAAAAIIEAATYFAPEEGTAKFEVEEGVLNPQPGQIVFVKEGQLQLFKYLLSEAIP